MLREDRKRLMSRTTIVCLLIFLGIVANVSAEDGFLDGFGGFIDTIGGLVESINFDFGGLGTSTSYSRNKNSYNYRDDSFINTYLWIRVIDSLFTPSHTTCPVGYNCIITDDGMYLPPPTLSAIILQHSIIALSCIALSLTIIFVIFDIVKRRSIRGKRITGMIVLWLIGILACIAVFFLFHVAKLLCFGIISFWPYFWPYFLAVTLVLFASYTLFWAYMHSGVRIVRQHLD